MKRIKNVTFFSTVFIAIIVILLIPQVFFSSEKPFPRRCINWSYTTESYVYSVTISSDGRYIAASSSKIYFFDKRDTDNSGLSDLKCNHQQQILWQNAV